MKTHFLLSDVNTGLIISGVFGIVTLLVTLVVIPLLNKVIAKQNIIHSQLDGMKDELVQATKALGEAVGNAQGRAELRGEQAAEKRASDVVIIVENKDKNVIIEKNLDK